MAASSKKLRFFYWVVRDLTLRYRRALIFGFVGGLLVTIIIGRLLPFFISYVAQPVQRIGIVGNIEPAKLPLTIQEKLSLGLTTLGPDGNVLPGLTDKWQYEDNGKSIVFTLGNHTWHDGKQLKAADINYNINGVVFQVIDQQTIKANLPEPFSPFVTIVSRPVFKSGLVGVGPYKLQRLRLKGEQIDSLTLAPVNGKDPVLEYHVFRTEQQAIIAFKRGDIDIVEDISTSAPFVDWKHISVVENLNYQRVIAVFFNTKDPFLSEKGLRQALSYATKTERERPHSPIPSTSWAYSESIKKYDYDPEQAKKLIAQLKLPTDFQGITITTFPQYADTARKVAADWTAVGIPTVVQEQNSLTENFQVLLSAQDVPADPDQYPFWHSKQLETNITKYTNVRVDKLLEDGRQEFDQEKRKKIYADFQRYLMEDNPAIFLYHPIVYTIKRK
jgi:peptide/nickel transport system substrate-binding protein